MARTASEDQVEWFEEQQNADEEEYEITLSLTEEEAEVLHDVLGSEERFFRVAGKRQLAGGLDDARRSLAEQMQDALIEEALEQYAKEREHDSSDDKEEPTIRELAYRW